jgi:hypothetical protein
VIEVAIATSTAPRDWFDEPDEVLATALDVLGEQAKRMKQATRKR